MTEEMKRFHFIPGYSPTTLKLIERLKTGKPGDKLTDAQPADVCGKNTSVGADGYQSLQSAVRACERQYGVVWRRVRDTGAIECLNATEIVGDANARRQHIKRVAKRAVNALGIASARGSELPDSERPKVMALAAQMGALAMFAEGRVTRQIETKKAPVTPDMGSIVKLFG